MSMRERQPGRLEAGAAWLEGTHRVTSPAQTWERVQPLLREAGVTRVADLTHLDSSGVPVHTAVRPRATTHVTSQGKGVSPILSKVSAVMESLEMWRAEQPLVPDLVDRPAGEPGDLVDYPVRALDLVDPSLVSDAMPLDWSRAVTVVSGEATFVPTRCVGMDRRAVDRWQPPTFTMWTNGLASGNTREEALLHAMCELAERHAIGRAAPDISAQPVAPHSLGDPVLDLVVEQLEATANRVDLYHLDSELGVPCFAATVRSDEGGGSSFAGFGCHPAPGVAACRAVTEAVQNRVALIAGTRDDIATWRYGREEQAPVTSPSRVASADRDEPACAAHATTGWSLDIAHNLRTLAERMEAHTGYAPCYVALTPDDYPIDVVKVVAPGLGAHNMAGLR
jgi:ribosomal protein S12 methylthiotransferase accessory factor